MADIIDFKRKTARRVAKLEPEHPFDEFLMLIKSFGPQRLTEDFFEQVKTFVPPDGDGEDEDDDTLSFIPERRIASWTGPRVDLIIEAYDKARSLTEYCRAHSRGFRAAFMRFTNPNDYFVFELVEFELMADGDTIFAHQLGGSIIIEKFLDGGEIEPEPPDSLFF